VKCRHCQTKNANRGRGLCATCYYTPGLRDRYPSTSKFARLGAGAYRNGNTPLPAEPTPHPPGSDAKVAVMGSRACRGESLWHPLDDPGDV
jgi:hypothetical protein